MVHKRPWDDKCKTLLENVQDKNQLDTVEQNQNMAANNQSTGNTEPIDPQLKAYNELLSTVKGMHSQIKGYEKRFDELSAKIGIHSPPGNQPSRAPDPLEPVFTSPSQATASRSDIANTEKPPKKGYVRVHPGLLAPYLHPHLQKH